MSLEEAKRKYREKTRPDGIGAHKWQTSRDRATPAWIEGCTRAGAKPGPETSFNYNHSLKVGQYRGGSADKWEDKYRRGMAQ